MRSVIRRWAVDEDQLNGGLHRVGRVAGDHGALRHAAQPGDLPLGELARGGDAALAQVGQGLGIGRRVAAGVERFPGLPVAHAAHRGQVGRQVAARAQRRTSSRKPAASMASKRSAMRAVQPGAIGGLQREQHAAFGGLGRLVVARMKARQRLAAAFPHLERALDALAVLRREPRGRHGVDLREPRVHGGPAVRGGFGVDARAHGRIGRGHGVDAVEQRLEIQHGAAHQQRQRAARADLADEPRGIGHEGGGAVALARIEDVDQVVRHRACSAAVGLAVPMSMPR
jgi:hypothetical protein